MKLPPPGCGPSYLYSEVFNLKPTSKLSRSCLKNPAYLLQIWFLRMVSGWQDLRWSSSFSLFRQRTIWLDTLKRELQRRDGLNTYGPSRSAAA
jgi:hypothetical protein